MKMVILEGYVSLNATIAAHKLKTGDLSSMPLALSLVVEPSPRVTCAYLFSVGRQKWMG